MKTSTWIIGMIRFLKRLPEIGQCLKSMIWKMFKYGAYSNSLFLLKFAVCENQYKNIEVLR